MGAENQQMHKHLTTQIVPWQAHPRIHLGVQAGVCHVGHPVHFPRIVGGGVGCHGGNTHYVQNFVFLGPDSVELAHLN